MSCVRVDREQCLRLARRVRTLRMNRDYFIPPPPPGSDIESLARAWILLVGICQQTRTLEGVVDGRWYRGSDYLFQKGFEMLVRDPDFFSPGRLRRLDIEGLRQWLSDDGRAESSTVDREAERVGLACAIGEFLERDYRGSAMKIWEASRGRVADAPDCRGLQSRLAECEAYADPMAKKTFLLLMYLDAIGVWPLEDPGRLDIPVDYHVMRVLLRTGVLEITDAEVHRRLCADEAAEERWESAIRSAAREACRIAVVEGGCPLLPLDAALWMVGRNCCFYTHDPLCRPLEAGECPERGRCSLLRGFDYPCAGFCPLEKICRGGREAAFRGLKEPRVETHYY